MLRVGSESQNLPVKGMVKTLAIPRDQKSSNTLPAPPFFLLQLTTPPEPCRPRWSRNDPCLEIHRGRSVRNTRPPVAWPDWRSPHIVEAPDFSTWGVQIQKIEGNCAVLYAYQATWMFWRKIRWKLRTCENSIHIFTACLSVKIPTRVSQDIVSPPSFGGCHFLMKPQGLIPFDHCYGGWKPNLLLAFGDINLKRWKSPTVGTKKSIHNNWDTNPSIWFAHPLHKTHPLPPAPAPCAAWPAPSVPRQPGGDAASPSARRPSASCACRWRGRFPGWYSGCKASPMAGAGSCPWKFNHPNSGKSWIQPRFSVTEKQFGFSPAQKVGWNLII